MEGVKIGLGVENTTMTIVRCVPYVFHVYFKCLQVSKVRYTHEIHMKYRCYTSGCGLDGLGTLKYP